MGVCVFVRMCACVWMYLHIRERIYRHMTQQTILTYNESSYNHFNQIIDMNRLLILEKIY